MPSPLKLVVILAWAKMWEVEVETERLGEVSQVQARIVVPIQFSLEQRAVSKHPLLGWLSDLAG